MVHTSNEKNLLKLHLNPKAKVEILQIGNNRQPVFIVDQAIENADDLVGFALTQTDFVAPAATSHYPGLIAQLPANYLPTILSAISHPMAKVFGYPPNQNLQSFGFFGLTTLPHAAMDAEQLLPHADSTHPAGFACVHYLGGAGFGGTAFYRHRATGLEVVAPSNSAACYKVRTEEIEACKDKPNDALMAYYDEIAYVDAVFNRLVLYRASQLHSAKMIGADTLPANPGEGRLTANIFVNI